MYVRSEIPGYEYVARTHLERPVPKRDPRLPRRHIQHVPNNRETFRPRGIRVLRPLPEIEIKRKKSDRAACAQSDIQRAEAIKRRKNWEGDIVELEHGAHPDCPRRSEDTKMDAEGQKAKARSQILTRTAFEVLRHLREDIICMNVRVSVL